MHESDVKAGEASLFNSKLSSIVDLTTDEKAEKKYTIRDDDFDDFTPLHEIDGRLEHDAENRVAGQMPEQFEQKHQPSGKGKGGVVKLGLVAQPPVPMGGANVHMVLDGEQVHAEGDGAESEDSIDGAQITASSASAAGVAGTDMTGWVCR